MPQHFLKGSFRTPVLLLSGTLYFFLFCCFLVNAYLIDFLPTVSFILNKSYSVQSHFMMWFNGAVLQRLLSAFLSLKLHNSIFFSFFSATLLPPFFCFAHLNSSFLGINDEKCTVFQLKTHHCLTQYH